MPTSHERFGGLLRRMRKHAQRPGSEAQLVFDREFHELARGRRFDSTKEALDDFLRVGADRRLSPHPALPFPLMPRSVREHWRSGDTNRVGDYLRSGATRDMVALGDDQRRRVLRSVASYARQVAVGDVPVREGWDCPPGGGTTAVTVVIPTFNDFRLTLKCVRAVLENTHSHGLELVVVDNGSALHVSHALAAQLPDDPRVHLLRSPVNANFAGGSNMGALASSGSTLVFLNNDTLVQPGWLDPLLAPLDDPDVLGTQSLLLYPDGEIQTAGTIFVDEHLLPCHLLAGQEEPSQLRALERWPFTAMTAACLAVRARDFFAVNGFDTGFRNGFEDVDLCMRLRSTGPAGAAFRLASGSRVVHLESRSPGRYRYVDENRERFLERWRHLLHDRDVGAFELVGYELVGVQDDGRQVPAARPTLRPRRDTERDQIGRLPHNGA